jgi:hypothetical protein
MFPSVSVQSINGETAVLVSGTRSQSALTVRSEET